MRIFAVILLTFLFISIGLKAQVVTKNGQLRVSGTQLENESGEAIVLRGVSFGWHNWWPRFYNEDVVDWLVKDWNCNIVRSAMGIEPDSAYLSNRDFAIQKMKAVVDAAIKNDIYVIIDWHSHHIHTNEAKVFFAQMAQEYGDNPHVIYEIYNEPVHDTWDEVKAYAIEVIDTIRAYDANNVILIGNPHWDQDIHIVAKDPILGYDNIMYTLHYYAATHKSKLRRRANYALKKGTPIFISESAGMQANGNSALDYKSWQKWIDWAEERKISWITWSIADKDETCSMLKKSASSEGNWSENDLKESGIKTREFLIEMNK